MLRVPTDELRPGMRLGKRITAADGRVLLPSGSELRDTYISTLRRMNLPAVYVTNEMAPDVEPVDVVSEQTRLALASGLTEAVSELGRTFAAQKSGSQRPAPALNMRRLKASVDMAVTDIVSNRHGVVSLYDPRSGDDHLVGHSVNVCIMSAFLGVACGLNIQQLGELALGALLHDIGKTALPPEVADADPATPGASDLLKQHPALGWDLLMKQPERSFTVAAVAMQHHERFQGGGYPRNIKGKEIHEYSRICAVADCFDMVVADRPNRRGLSPRRGLDKLSGLAGHLDPEILSALLGSVARYPVGAMVEVTDGFTAVVVGVERGKTARPRIRLLKDAGGAALSNKVEVDLSTRNDMQILRSLPETASDFTPNWLS